MTDASIHRVVGAHLDDFNSRFGIATNRSKAFEAFVNHIVLKSISSDSVSPTELVYEGDDPGIDGVMIFVDDKYVSSAEEVEDALKGKRRDCEATVVFTQAKTSERWDKGEINKFQSAIDDFLRDESNYPHSEFLKQAKEVFDALIRHVGRLKGGKPQALCCFATTGREPNDREILAAFRTIQANVEATGLFAAVKVRPLDRDLIIDLWNASDGPVEATLPVIAMAAFPKAPGVEEGYVVTVKAKEFVQSVLSDEHGRLRKRIFEENVRDFIGLDADVNHEMTETLLDVQKQKRFGMLNNGVTLISPDLRVQGNELYLRDFQIVNGCQTSNVLFEQRDQLSDEATLMLKVIETDDASLVDEIVRSTNRQTKVQDEQFLATLDCVKAVEKYFVARGQDETHSLFFERRQNQFADTDVKAIRVYDIKEVARATGAMFLDKPELASRYPNRLTGDMRDIVFQRNNVEEIYYTAAYALYRLQLHIGNNRINSKYSKLRWHILMAIKYYIHGDNAIYLSSPKVRTLCTKIDAFMNSSDDESLEKLKRLCAAIADVESVTRDQIKGLSFVTSVKTAALHVRNSDGLATT